MIKFSNAKYLVAPIALILFSVEADAQARRFQTSTAEAQNLEAALKGNPRDRAARSALLDYYFVGRIDPAVAVPARRRHILWLIENTPEDDLAGRPAATIDAAGHYLADPVGFKMASDAWRTQVAKPDVSASSLVHAAYFFKLSDKTLTIRLLERALALDPASKEIGARLGDEYALAIMGVTMVNKNGYPMEADPGLTRSALATRARDVLATSRNPYLLAKAGYMLLWQGAVLYYSGKLPFDADPLAKTTLERAVSLAPGDAEVAGYGKQYDAMHREYERIRHSVGTLGQAKSPASAPSASRATSPSSASVERAAPPPREVSPDDLKKVAEGMSREQLLRLGSPAGRITMDEDGHLIEIYEYSANGMRLGTVRLTDGAVSSVRIP